MCYFRGMVLRKAAVDRRTGSSVSIQGKTAVVTGGSRGIGRAYCERLAADGANVVVIDLRDPAGVAQELKGVGAALGIACDVSDPAAVREAANAVLDRFGRCDIFVNNAAMLDVTSLETVTIEQWRRIQAVNVEPIIGFAQAFVPGMADAGWGRIVTTGSSSTLNPLNRDLAYVTSKGSVHALTRALANELGDRGITVNSIAPTVVRTEGFVERLPGGELAADEMITRIAAQHTVGRFCEPEDVADMLGFLVSDQAGFITGQILHVDGGRTRSGA
jgi:NAD(P)-dependent dehydrogenase (short-subunit alcohol dehydrogenase family)